MFEEARLAAVSIVRDLSRMWSCFGDQFRFGVSTSAYQIEGSTEVDGRGDSIWDTFCGRAGTIDDASSGAVAADHYRRWQSDLDLLQRLGIESYRFSIAWPRVMPTGRGPVNQRGLDFYKRLLDGLQQRGIAPVVTLFHWDLPQALQDGGGWENRDCAGWFADYAAVLFDALDGVQTWLTINEPKIIVQQGYQLGWMAPGLHDNVAAGRAIHHLGLAHGLAVQALRASGRPGEIGPVQVLTPVYPADADAARAGTDPRHLGEHPVSRPDLSWPISEWDGPARSRRSPRIGGGAPDRRPEDHLNSGRSSWAELLLTAGG